MAKVDLSSLLFLGGQRGAIVCEIQREIVESFHVTPKEMPDTCLMILCLPNDFLQSGRAGEGGGEAGSKSFKRPLLLVKKKMI